MKCFKGEQGARHPRKTIRKTLLLAVLLPLLVSACIRPHKKTDEDYANAGADDIHSTFILAEKVSGSGVNDSVDLHWFFPKSKTYSFIACFKDKRTQKPVVGTRFEVIELGVQTAAPADGKGCVSWHETVAFNYLADKPMYIPLTRTLHAVDGHGAQSGRRQLKLAVNPWDDKSSVHDLENEEIPNDQIANTEQIASITDSSASQSTGRHLWVSNLSLNISDTGNAAQGRNLEIHAKLAPQVTVGNVDGSAIFVPLVGGEYTAEFYFRGVIRHDGQDPIYSKIGRAISAPVKLDSTNGALLFKIPMQIFSHNTEGQIEVGLRLTPVHAPSALRSFEGVFFMGSFADLLGSKSIDRQPDQSNAKPGFLFNNFLKESSFDLADAASSDGSSSAGVEALEPFEFTELQLANFMGVTDLSPTERTVSYQVGTTVRDSITKAAIANQEFTITDLDGEHLVQNAGKFATDNEGHLKWYEKINHKYYKPATFFTRSVRLTTASGFTKDLRFAVNPWDSGFRMLYDMSRPVQEWVKEVQNRPKITSKLIWKNYAAEQRFQVPYVDQFLNIYLKETYSFSFQPRVTRYSAVESGLSNSTEDLRPGYYLMKVGMQLDYNDYGQIPLEHIWTDAKVVKVDLGGIEPTTFDIVIRDPKILNVRNVFLMELHPLDYTKYAEYLVTHPKQGEPLPADFNWNSLIDHDSGLVTPTYIGPLWLQSKQYSAQMSPTDSLHTDFCGMQDCPVPSKARTGENDYVQNVSDQSSDIRNLYGGKRKLENINVDTLRRREPAIRTFYNQVMANQARLQSFVNSQNVELIPMHSQAQMLSENPGIQIGNRLFTNAKMPFVNQLIESINKSDIGFAQYSPIGFHSDFTLNDFEKLTDDGVLDRRWGRALCFYWFRNFIPETAGASILADGSAGVPKFFGHKAFYEHAIRDCQNAILHQSVEAAFSVEQKIRILSPVESVPSPKPQSWFLRVGQSFKFGQDHSAGHDFSVGLYPMGFVEGGLNIFEIAPERLLNILSFASGAKFGWGWSWRSSKEIGQGEATESGATLSVVEQKVRIKAKAYQKCTILRLNSNLLRQIISPEVTEYPLTGIFAANVDGQTKLAVLERGLMFCPSDVTNQPINIEESYFMTNKVDNPVFLDPGSPDTYPWTMVLRGPTDFMTLVEMIKADPGEPGNVNIVGTNIADRPIAKLKAAYDQYALGEKTGSQPGVYSPLRPIAQKSAAQINSENSWWSWIHKSGL
jgi:hypothetical protein